MTDFMMASLKECQACGEEFTPKRSDAKYCSIKCKNALNNYRNREEEAEHEAIVGEAHAILWKNRSILLEHLDDSVSLSTLEATGFKTNNITRFQKSEEGKNEFLIYDIWYQITKTDSGFEFKIYKK